MPICVLPAIDCELTEWSQWSECNKSCGKGHMIRTRMIQMEPQFGGAPCPETVQRKKCRVRKCLKNPSIQKLRWREARESRRSEQLREESDGEQFPGTTPNWGTVQAGQRGVGLEELIGVCSPGSRKSSYKGTEVPKSTRWSTKQADGAEPKRRGRKPDPKKSSGLLRIRDLVLQEGLSKTDLSRPVLSGLEVVKTEAQGQFCL